MSAKIILIRHGVTDWNLVKRYQGHTDIPLNESGQKQARDTAKLLTNIPIDIIYTSDLSRAYQTAEIIAEGKNIPIHKLKTLRETHFGQWEGLTIEEIRERFPEDVERLKKDPIHGIRPGGESRMMMFERVKKTLREIIHKHPHQTVAIISHQGALAAAVCAITGEEYSEGRKKYRLENTSYHVLEMENGKWLIRHFGKIAKPMFIA